MSKLKCRYCGGQIADIGNRIGKCDSCGILSVMPELNKKISEELYNRADHLRRIHDYDGAISAYEHIIAENPSDSEARWSLVLCKYGVEYTYDRRTDSYLPTINRMSLDSILEDRDYLKALEYSEGEAKEDYRCQALKLAAIQDELEKIVRENENYDVFISFKATDDNRKRTRDYFLAQEIYDTLSAAGLRVFFSPVSLRAHVGEVYEPYIFAALYSSKVLVLVGTKKEYLNSEWVKNEWSRYLFMARQDSGKHILPVCEEMKPEEFPAEIGKMQAVSMKTVGALEIIKERVMGYAGGQSKRIYVKKADGSRMDLTNQVRRLQFAVEDGDFADARDWIQKLRGMAEEKMSETEYFALLTKYKAKDENELAAHIGELEQDADYFWLLENGSEEHKAILKELEERRDINAKRKFESEFIEELTRVYEAGNFERVVEAVEKAQKVEGTFERSTEIDDLYQNAKQKCNAKEQLTSYREKVGDGSTYLRERLEELYPERAKQVKLLRKEQCGENMLSKLDKLAGFGGVAGLIIIAVWLVLKEKLTTPVLIFDIALYLIYCAKEHQDYEKTGQDAPKSRVITKSLITLVVSLVAMNFTFPGGLGGFSAFWGKYFSNGTTDDGLIVYIYMVPLFFLILWGFRLQAENNRYKKQSREVMKYKKELLDFLKHFEAQEEIRLMDEYGSISEEDRVPLQSIYWE